jgi:hypothetical protein
VDGPPIYPRDTSIISTEKGTTMTSTDPQDYPTMQSRGVQLVVAPFSVSIGHSFELSALALLAVGLKLAYDRRSRHVVLQKGDLVVVNEQFHPRMPLSELMERLPITEPEAKSMKARK